MADPAYAQVGTLVRTSRNAVCCKWLQDRWIFPASHKVQIIQGYKVTFGAGRRGRVGALSSEEEALVGNAGRQRLQAALRGQRLPETHDSSVGKQALPGVAARARARAHKADSKKQPEGFRPRRRRPRRRRRCGSGVDARRCGLGKERVWNEATGRRRAGRGVAAGVSRACGTARRRDGWFSALRTDVGWSRGKR